MNAVDVDWCLYCNQHTEGGAPYCSVDCRSKDQPLVSVPHIPFCATHSSLHTLSSTDNDRDVVYHTIHEVVKAAPSTGGDRAGIEAWAASIPSNASDGFSSPQSSRASSRCPSPQPMRTPQLLLNHRRPIAPTLCMSTPQPTCPKQSRPILTPQQSIASMNISPRSCTEAATPGASVTSLLSVTDSFVATPSSASVADPLSHHEPSSSKPAAMFEALATQVRTWVHPPHLQSPKPRAAFPAMRTGYQQNRFNQYPAIDESDSDAVWWATDGSVVSRNSAMKRHSAEKTQPPRARTDSKGAHGAPDHPAYRARGRKASRPFP